MAFGETPILQLTFEAGADLSTHQYKFVKQNSSGQIVLCSAVTDVPVGVLQDKPVSGQRGTVMVIGLTKLKCNAAINPGVQISTDASGLGNPVVAGTDTTKFIVGQMRAVSSATSGAFGTALINCLNPARGA